MGAGHYRPAYIGGENVDETIYKAFESAFKKDVSKKPIELEQLGNFLASDFLGNFPVAMKDVLRTSHRTLEVPRIVAEAFDAASPEAHYNFAVAIRPVLVNLLILTPFSRASAEAGRADEAPPPVEGQRQSGRNAAKQAERARELVVEAPPLKWSQDDQRAMRGAAKTISAAEAFIHACDELVIKVMQRLIAQRDAAFAAGLGVKFLTASKRRELEAKYPGAASFEREADAEFGKEMGTAYASAAGSGGGGSKAWRTLATQPFAETFNDLPKKVKLRSAALVLWTRLARGEHDKIYPVRRQLSCSLSVPWKYSTDVLLAPHAVVLAQLRRHERHGPHARLGQVEPAPLHP